MDIEFRSATPDDVDAAVPLIYSSGPAAFDYVFARPGANTAEAFLRAAFLDGAGEFGFRNHTVAVVDGAVAAIGAAFDGAAARGFMPAAARQMLAFYGPLHWLGPARRGLQVERVIPPPTGDLHYLAHLGVAPALRGRGIGRRLIDHLLAQGRARGRSRAALDVAVTNPRAEALYARLGFATTAERRSTLRNAWATVADHRRMERPLP